VSVSLLQSDKWSLFVLDSLSPSSSSPFSSTSLYLCVCRYSSGTRTSAAHAPGPQNQAPLPPLPIYTRVCYIACVVYSRKDLHKTRRIVQLSCHLYTYLGEAGAGGRPFARQDISSQPPGPLYILAIDFPFLHVVGIDVRIVQAALYRRLHSGSLAELRSRWNSRR
jgi:hypothetical protein